MFFLTLILLPALTYQASSWHLYVLYSGRHVDGLMDTWAGKLAVSIVDGQTIGSVLNSSIYLWMITVVNAWQFCEQESRKETVNRIVAKGRVQGLVSSVRGKGIFMEPKTWSASLTTLWHGLKAFKSFRIVTLKLLSLFTVSRIWPSSRKILFSVAAG